MKKFHSSNMFTYDFVYFPELIESSNFSHTRISLNQNLSNSEHIIICTIYYIPWNDVNSYGTLNNFSTFCFWKCYDSNFKKMIRKYDKPLQQIAYRLEESDTILKEKLFITNNYPLFCNQHLDGPLIENVNNIQHWKVIFKEFTIVCDGKNNYVELKRKEIACIENIVYQNMYNW